MRVTSLLPLLVRSRMSIRTVRLELERGRDRADFDGDVGQDGLESGRLGGDSAVGAIDGDKDGGTTHILPEQWVD
jgi:hypothetical protein